MYAHIFSEWLSSGEYGGILMNLILFGILYFDNEWNPALSIIITFNSSGLYPENSDM